MSESERRADEAIAVNPMQMARLRLLYLRGGGAKKDAGPHAVFGHLLAEDWRQRSRRRGALSLRAGAAWSFTGDRVV